MGNVERRRVSGLWIKTSRDDRGGKKKAVDSGIPMGIKPGRASSPSSPASSLRLFSRKNAGVSGPCACDRASLVEGECDVSRSLATNS